MRTLIATTILCATFLTFQAALSQPPKAHKAESAGQSAASTYGHLATAIIEIESTEDELVKSILIGYHSAARHHLTAAAHDAKGQSSHLEAAAAEIANIANEGDKSIQAIRQRLAKAGHTHNTDVETKGDYIWITNREKKGLLELAGKIGHAGADAKPSDLAALSDQLDDLFEKAVAPE